MFQAYCAACTSCCSQAPLEESVDLVEQSPATLESGYKADAFLKIVPIPDSGRKNPTMAELVQALKNGGGVVDAPGSEQNCEFLNLIDLHLPELKIYSQGKIQTSPGVEEIEGSSTEYYRTVGAMIALLAGYASVVDDEFGIDAVTKGSRGPMSMDKIPGKFINMGGKPDAYKAFCKTFAETMANEDDWWAMFVFLAVHDVGKSDTFRNAVNATLPIAKRSDDHDRALARALTCQELKTTMLPSVMRLSPKRQEMITAGFLTNFQMPQLGQGEIAVINLRGLLEMPKEHLDNGALKWYLYHSIFDIAGAGANAKFIYPLAIVPVYLGFSGAIQDLLQKLQAEDMTKMDEKGVYFQFLHSGFKKAFPEFEENVFRPLCESKIFRDETGLVVLRILALTRNTYKNPQKVLDICNDATFAPLVREMSGNPSPPGPQIMLYYCPDMLRMGLGEDLADESGENMKAALGALDDLHRLAREQLSTVTTGDYQYQLNVQPMVSAIKDAGKAWAGGTQLRECCNGASIESNQMKTEGILVMRKNEAAEK